MIALVSVAAITFFEPNLIKLVDKSENSYLFRGNIPKNKQGDFDKNLLLDSLYVDRAIKKEDYQICLFSLMTYERKEESDFLENLYFQFTGKKTLKVPMKKKIEHPNGDAFYFWQVRAHIDPLPRHYLLSDIKELLFFQIFDKKRLMFCSLIDKIEKEMNDDIPKIIYVHCRHGRNRTSAVIMGYLMKKYGIDLDRAWDIALNIPGSHQVFQPDQLRAFLELYEWYLERYQRPLLQKSL